ncbi:MAG TPA: hypothetical protein VNN75_07215, partial [Stellaceae bacterium]|nr:hypothetical protein [Stellaceae bacterium]
DPAVHYLVGTPKGRLTRLERHLIAKPWQEARPGVSGLDRSERAQRLELFFSRGTEGLQTRRWREKDSNYRSPV